MKKVKFVLAGVILSLAGFLMWLYGQYSVPIIMYHRVEYAGKLDPNSVTPENFAKQMKFFKDHGYQVISLDALVEGIKARRAFPRNSVVITFDDGYANNYQYAYPTLKEYGYPATVFAISDLVGQKDFLTWDQIKEMQSFKISIGSHTRQHAYLPEVSPEKQIDEIEGSKKIFDQKLGVSTDYFSYPSGGFSQSIEELVKKAGYKGACTTNRGHQNSNKDVYALKRIRLSDKDLAPSYLRIKLSGYYNLFRESKDPS